MLNFTEGQNWGLQKRAKLGKGVLLNIQSLRVGLLYRCFALFENEIFNLLLKKVKRV